MHLGQALQTLKPPQPSPILQLTPFPLVTFSLSKSPQRMAQRLISTGLM
jgi:hypothetical protein